eukprot:gb/GECG01003885.1/.p1 GENE.gb/GECG01003885.1/~~gb/GECG01003885.1/.p1  ORF type:complete len:197 (+),score=29.58 gb/GECG01003885.1/:1-591(+)
MNDLFSHNIYKRARLNRSGRAVARSKGPLEPKQGSIEADSASYTPRIHDESSWMNALSNSSSSRKGDTEKRTQYQQRTLDGFFGRSPSGGAKSTTSAADASEAPDLPMNEVSIPTQQQEKHSDQKQLGNGYHPLVTPLDSLLQRRNASVGLTKELTDILYQCETAKALLHYIPAEQAAEFEVDELGDSSSEDEQLH